jgi:hypothetical protein
MRNFAALGQDMRSQVKSVTLVTLWSTGDRARVNAPPVAEPG